MPRSLNGVIEQMEMFSSSLQELTSRVEATHVTATQERELGVRQRDEQLRGAYWVSRVVGYQEECRR